MVAPKRHQNEIAALCQPFIQQFGSKSDFNAHLRSTIVAVNIPTNK